jgi:ACR3 family arsenite efflux pump ArsB
MNKVKAEVLKVPQRRTGIIPLLAMLQNQLVISVPVAMLLGIIVGYFYETSFLKKLIIPATFLMVYPMMVPMNFKKLLEKGDLRLLIITQLFNFILVPALGYFIGWLFFYDNIAMRIGVLLIALIPTSGMTITWTGIAKGNMHEAIRITISGLLLGAVLAPVYLKGMLGEAVDIPLSRIFIQIAMVVFVPLVLGNITQKWLVKTRGKEKFQKELKQKFPPFSTLGVLMIVFIAMSVKSKAILARPEMLLGIIGPLVVFYLLLFFMSIFKARTFFVKADAIAMVYGTAMRNLSIALAIAMTVFKQAGSDIALVIAIAFIVQVQLAVWYVRFVSRIMNNA